MPTNLLADTKQYGFTVDASGGIEKPATAGGLKLLLQVLPFPTRLLTLPVGAAALRPIPACGVQP